MDFDSLAGRAQLQPEAAAYAAPAARLLEGTELLERAWRELLPGDREEDTAKTMLSDAAAGFGMEPNRVLLAATVLLTRNMEDEYRKHGYAEDIFLDSLQDIPIWAKCCHEETGLWGMKQFSWLEKTLRAKLWRLGRLEFEHIGFEAEHYGKNGVILNKDDTVINVHIPEGSPITREKCEDSFKKAVSFFGSNVFVCESWLLWPAHREMLDEKSNIRAFMDLFDIVEAWEKPDTHDLWRIFGYLKDYTPETLPERTKLQRAYKKRLIANGGLTGGGYGVYIFKG